MTIFPSDTAQQRAARVVGFCYLFAMALAVFGESYVRGKLIVAGDAAGTARNIMAHELLFRLGIASELLTFVSDTILIAALYVILRVVNPHLALLAVFFRLIETANAVVMTLSSLDVLRLLSGADYLHGFEAARLQALARLSLSAHGAAYNVTFLFLGLGSTVFAWLWLESGYIPKALAILGIVGSFLLAAGAFTYVIVPTFVEKLGMSYMMPLGLFEVTMGFLLLIRGLGVRGIPRSVGA
jgi:hypothetical protein